MESSDDDSCDWWSGSISQSPEPISNANNNNTLKNADCRQDASTVFDHNQELETKWIHIIQ